ncbi:MAG: hypothetical protein IJW82_03535 [Clostridia bacterium]|nr:hypothetical protein [Clostridia bacterium]
MFYIGLISGLLSIFIPLEPIHKVNQASEWIDIIRFYIHHSELWIVSLLMVTLKLHTLDYKRILSVPTGLLLTMLFIILNQFIQSELGFIPLRDNNFFNINWKNSSYIYGPGSESFTIIFTALCPKIFKTIPVGIYKGQTKYWPWFWLIVPVYFYLTPISFGISMIFDRKHFIDDFKNFKIKFNHTIENFKTKNINQS